MQAMRGMNIPLPKALAGPAEFILNEALCKIIRDDRDEYANPLEHLQILADEAARFSLQLDKDTIQFEASRKINRLMTQLKETPENSKLLETIEATVRILLSIVTELNLQTAQNVFFDISKKTYPEMNEKAQAGDRAAQKWVEHFTKLARYLGVRIQ
jgi:GTPase involved in cell partitioning and DNA repair